MSEAERLQEAEADIASLLHRIHPALPVLQRIVDDTDDWRKDIRKTILEHLEAAVDRARNNQAKRRRETA